MASMHDVKLTNARREGLRACLRMYPASCPISNITTTGVDFQSSATVYWQTARWLTANGLARPSSAMRESIVITKAGQDLARREHIR